MTSSVELASHQQEIDSIIECHQFLVGFKILEIVPCTVSRCIKFKLFPDGESRPVVWVKALPKMDVISYPSLEDLMIHLMASVSFFYAGDDITKKYRIHANMVIAIRNHRKISAPDLVSWGANFFSQEFGDEASRAESASARCNVNMTVLRGLAEVFGCPQLYVGTAVYDPSKLSLEVAKSIRPTCPLLNVESIRPRRRRSAGPRAGKSKSFSSFPRWYTSHNFERRDWGVAVSTLVNRYRALRFSGSWQRQRVKEPVPVMYAALENGGAMRVFGHCMENRTSMASVDYYSAEALFVDIMCNVCTVLDSRGEYGKQSSLAAVLDCVTRHWPVGDSDLAALWKEMTTWLWRLACVDCLDLNDPQQTLVYLERCDKHLKEFQQRFVSRTTVGGTLNVWKKIYMPPGTVWRKLVMDELNRHSGTRKNVLFKIPELRTYNFVYPTPESAAEQAVMAPSGSKKLTGKTQSSAGEGATTESTACSALTSTAGGLVGNVLIPVRNETNPVSAVEYGVGSTRQLDPCGAGQHNDEHSRLQRRKKSENAAASPGEQTPIDNTRVGHVSKQEAVAEDLPRNVRVKSEVVDIIDVSSSSSASEDEKEDESDDRRCESIRDGRSDGNGDVKGKTRRGLVSGRKRSQPSEDQERADAGESGAPECGDRKRRLDETLGCDYRERMRAVQVLLKRYRDHFPDHLGHFEVFDAHVRNLGELAAPKKFTKVVTKMLDEQCIEKTERLFGGFLKKFGALVDPSVKEEMETCLDALSLVLNDSRMLVNFQAQFKKKQRRQ